MHAIHLQILLNVIFLFIKPQAAYFGSHYLQAKLTI